MFTWLFFCLQDDVVCVEHDQSRDLTEYYGESAEFLMAVADLSADAADDMQLELNCLWLELCICLI